MTDTAIRHDTRVVTRIDKTHGIRRQHHRARCTCPWVGKWRWAWRIADADARAHGDEA